MASCAACGTFIVFGGSRDEHGNRFCNDKCLRGGAVARVAASVPDDLVAETAASIHAGPCPSCRGPGPIDLHQSHQVLSFLVATRWASKSHLACKGCARKKQLGGVAISLAGGWWGFPWGLIMTPVQVSRNIGGMLGGPRPEAPSPMLMQFARETIALEMAQSAAPIDRGGRGFEVVQPTGALPPPLPTAR